MHVPAEATASEPGTGQVARTALGSRHRWWWALLAVALLGGAVFTGVNAYRAGTVGVEYADPPAAPLPGGDLTAARDYVKASGAVPGSGEMPANSLLIPDLRIHAPLLEVGVRQSDVEVPFDAGKVGVYDKAAALTDASGSSVLVGHVTNGAVRGAFFPLAAARPGMRIWTRDGHSRPFAWRVTTVVAYPRDDLPQEIFDAGGARRLMLITCGGKVITVGSRRHYADSVVVEAVPMFSRTGS